MTDAHATTIRTTHTGSLPDLLPQQSRLQELLTRRIGGQKVDQKELRELSDLAVDAAVGWQVGLGLDSISGGEADRAGFMDSSRVAGWGTGPEMSLFRPRDLEEAGALDWFLAQSGMVPPRMNAGAVKHDPELVGTEISRLLNALARHGVPPSAAFMPEPSPGIMSTLGTVYYDTDEEFLTDVTAALREEYRTITDSGLTLQVDAPDLVVDWFTWHQNQSPDEYLKRLRRSVQAINDAIEGIPPEQVRVHVCHGNWPGPHHHDIDLSRVIGDTRVINELYQLRAGTLVLALANPRHRWERRLFSEPGTKLPAGMNLAAGVVEPGSECVEHVETIADGLTRLARSVGPERLMAATDCGFRSMLGLSQKKFLAELKLRALVAGARRASERLAGERLAVAAG